MPGGGLQKPIIQASILLKSSINHPYETTAESISSDEITNRCLTFLGHILRLPNETPVRECLDKFNIRHKKPSGAQKQTWIRSVSKDLESREVDLRDTTRLA